MSNYICRDFGDISKWLPIQTLTAFNNDFVRQSSAETVTDTDIKVPGGLGSMINYKLINDAFVTILSALKGKCSVYKSRDFMGKAPLTASDLSLLNDLKKSNDVALLLNLKLMQSVYVNEAGSQGNLPTTSNYIEKGNGILISNRKNLSDCEGIPYDSVYFYAVYTAPFGKAYGVNTHKLQEEIGALSICETITDALAKAKSGNTAFVCINKYKQVKYLKQNYPDILSDDGARLTNRKQSVFGYGSLDWLPEFYLSKLKTIDEEDFNSFVSVNSLSDNLVYFSIIFLLDCVYNLPASKTTLTKTDFSQDVFSRITRFSVPARKDNETDAAYQNRCRLAVNQWISSLSSKPGLKSFLTKQASLNRFTFVSNVSVRYNNIIKGLNYGQ